MDLSTIIATAPGRPKRGRPKVTGTPRERIVREAAVGRYHAGDLTAQEVADAFGVNPSTLRRWARELAQRN